MVGEQSAPCDSCTHRLKGFPGFPYAYKGVCIGCSGKVLIGGQIITIGEPWVHYAPVKEVKDGEEEEAVEEAQTARRLHRR